MKELLNYSTEDQISIIREYQIALAEPVKREIPVIEPGTIYEGTFVSSDGRKVRSSVHILDDNKCKVYQEWQDDKGFQECTYSIEQQDFAETRKEDIAYIIIIMGCDLGFGIPLNMNCTPILNWRRIAGPKNKID